MTPSATEPIHRAVAHRLGNCRDGRREVAQVGGTGAEAADTRGQLVTRAPRQLGHACVRTNSPKALLEIC